MNNDLLSCIQKPLIKEKDGIIVDANELFCHLTRFTKNELCGKQLSDIWDKLFRSDNKISITTEEITTTLFTKTFDVRFVKAIKHANLNKIENHKDINRKNKHSKFDGSINLYIFDEIENSRLDDKLLFIQSLIDDNAMGIAIYTANDLRLIKANQKYLDYMPKPFNTKEVIYGKCVNTFLPDFRERGGNDIIDGLIKQNKPVYFTELQGYILGDDSYWDNTITPISENGEVKYILSVLNNVTERVLSRKHIQKKNRQLESIIESVDDIISIVDKDGNYIKHNKMTTQIFKEKEASYVGYSTNVGRHYDFAGNPIPIDDLCFIKLLKGEKVKGQKAKYVYNNKEYYFILNAMPIFDEEGKFEMGVIVSHDITELVKKNKLISSQNKELEIIIDNMYDGLTVIDRNGNYIKKNKALCNSINTAIDMTDINEVGETLIKGQKYYNEHDEELQPNQFPPLRVFRGETVKEQRVIIKRKNDKVYLDFNGVPIFDENGNFQLGIILSHDITHIIQNNNRIKLEHQLLIKAEQEKVKAAKKTLAMKDEFISLISHEFKTPLNVIYSAIQLIEYVYLDQIPNKVQDLINNIKQNTFRQLRLVNNLLDITRLNSGRFKITTKSIDIVSFIRQISQSVRLYSDQKNIKLLFKCSLTSKIISTDDEKLERIILNLISNAVKFTDVGGTVTINLDEDESKNIIILDVADTGIGIPKDKQEIIFERFGQVDSNLSRHAEGTGIGLSLVKKLVDVLNGKIELESELGIGSNFRITIPANQQIEKEFDDSFLVTDNRLVNSLNVEFSDIYL